MEITKHFESSEHGRLELIIDIGASEDDYWVNDISVYIQEPWREIELTSLEPEEQRAIEELAESVAYDKAPEALQAMREAQADMAYEMMREEGWE